MANLTVERDDQRQTGELIDVDVAAVKIIKGANVNSNAAGFAKGAGDVSGEKFLGVAVDTVDNSGGSAGAKNVRVWTEGVFSMGCSGAAQTWVGQDVFAVDDNLVALAATTTNDVRVGKVVKYVSATEVRVKI